MSDIRNVASRFGIIYRDTVRKDFTYQSRSADYRGVGVYHTDKGRFVVNDRRAGLNTADSGAVCVNGVARRKDRADALVC